MKFNSGVFYNIDHTWRADRKRGHFFDVLPKQLTLKDLSWGEKSYMLDSMFEEVKMLPMKLNQEQIKLKRFLSDIDKTNEPFEKNVFECFCRIVEKEWGSFNVISHSAGYDSRVLGAVIKELGYDNYVFVECSGEGVEFRKIMKAQGFKNWMIYNETVKPEDYHEYSFNFDPERYNGLVGYPMNIWYDPWKSMVESGVIPKDSKFFSGPGAYIERMFKKWGFMGFCKREYYWQLSIFNFYGDRCIPWLDYDYINEIGRHRKITSDKHGRVSVALSDKYCRHLDHIPNPSIYGAVKDRGYRHVSDRIMRKLTDEYKNSWFGKHYPIEPSNYIEYNLWWTYFNASQICEYLINKGYKIGNA